MSASKHTWVNGRPQAEISVFDRGLAFGDGLFETIRIGRDSIPLLDYHLARLQAGAGRLGIAIDVDTVRADIAAAQAVAARTVQPVWRLKYIVTRGNSDSGYTPPPKSSPNRIMHLLPYDAGLSRLLQQQGVKTASCQWRLSEQPALAGIKHLNRLDQIKARQELVDSDCYEGFMRDQHGHYIEGTMSNLFAVSRNNELVTPSIDGAGVAGVMRQVIMDELAPAIDMPCYNADIVRMTEFAEVFISNAMIGIVPVIAVDKTRFAIGPVTRQLQQQLQQRQLMP